MNKLTLVLDNLRSCHNVGSIIRTANGFGCRNFIFIGTTPYPEISADQRLQYQIRRQTTQISKTALGAETEIQGHYYETSADFLSQNKGRIVCLEQTTAAVPLNNWQPAVGDFLVFGNELEGVSTTLTTVAQTCLIIPMRGSKESFNVAVAAGISLYHFSLYRL